MIHHVVTLGEWNALPGQAYEWEEAVPAPPPGAAEGTLFPHVFGPINRDAVERILEIQWDEEGRATGIRLAG